MRILIIGAGVAGLTLAALLQQRGERPVLVERHPERPGRGYMLGLMPLGGRVLNGLGLRDAYLAQSRPMRSYEFYGRHGRRLGRFALDAVIERFGAYQGIDRGSLIDLLRQRVARETVAYETTVDAIEHTDDGARVVFSDGSTGDFDLVVGADGINSAVRSQILDAGEYSYWSTGWGGWVTWIAGSGRIADDTYRELWSAGWGIGLYPVRERVGVFLCGDLDRLNGYSYAGYLEALRERVPHGPFREALDAADPDDDAFFWRMEDCGTTAWRRGNVILVGDAAAGFLPTAGVGASMAMDSAAALADELSRAERDRMAHALTLFERRQRGRVERAQRNSRFLARLMFVNARPWTFLRDQAMRFYTTDRLIREIAQVMEGR